MPVAIGIDVGGTQTKAAVVTGQGQVLHELTEPTARDLPASEVPAFVAGLIARLLAAASVARSDLAGACVGLPGVVEPRLDLAFSCPNLRSWEGFPLGPQVAALAERFELHGRPVALMDWQRLALNRALRVDEAGGFLHDTVGLVVARGNGKTLLLAARALWGVLARGETVLGTAQNLPTAEQPWQLVHDWLRSVDERAGRDPEAPGSWWNKHVERVDRARGVKSLYLRNGGAYLVRSHRRAARGLRAHCVMVDEAREWRGEEAFTAWGAIVGTQAGLGLGRDTQLVVASNAGDDDSLVLNMLRDTGRAAAAQADPAASLCWLEWSAAPDRDLLDPRGWAEANPALGVRVRPDQLAARAHADPEPVFRTEHLSQWVAVTAAAIAPGTWHACRRDVALQREWGGVLGVEVSFDRRHAAIVLASTDEDGVAHLRLLHAEHAPDGGIDLVDLANRVGRYWQDGVARRVAVDPRSAGPLVDHLKRLWTQPEKHLRLLGGGRLAGATAELMARAESRRLAHDGDQLLAEHVLAAGVKPSGDGGMVLSRRASTGPIAAAVAAALAVHGAGESESRPRFRASSGILV